MKQLFEYRRDSMSQHKNNTAVLTVSKFLHSESSYRGGTREYLHAIDIELGRIKFRKAWWSKEYADAA